MSYDRVITYRPDTSSNWSAINPVLSLGEGAIETDTGKTKVGDGVTAYNSLGYSQKIVESSGDYIITPPSGGRFLAYDTNNARCKVYTASFTTTANGFYTVLFDTIKYDPLNSFDITNNWYVAPYDGVYIATLTIRIPDLGSGGGNNIQLGLGIRATIEATDDTDRFSWGNSTEVSPASRRTRQFVRLDYFNKGDKIVGYYYFSSSLDCGATFSIKLLS